MSRFKILAANPRRSLAALATVLVAVGVTGASGANFNAASANPSNTFTAGTLSMSNSLPGAAILTASNLRPGDAVAPGVVDIANTGSLTSPFVLSKGTVVDTLSAGLMSSKLNLKVVDCGDFASGTPTCAAGAPVIYAGTIADMGTPGHAVAPLGSFAGGVKHRYEFSVDFDGSADDTFQGGKSVVQFLWNATS
jgi:Camelysin metallo-endopeptidase